MNTLIGEARMTTHRHLLRGNFNPEVFDYSTRLIYAMVIYITNAKVGNMTMRERYNI
jgi:hypothetical protein